MATGIGRYLENEISTFVSTFIFSILLAFLSFHGSSVTSYNLGNEFIGWFLIFFMYIGAIILIYRKPSFCRSTLFYKVNGLSTRIGYMY